MECRSNQRGRGVRLGSSQVAWGVDESRLLLYSIRHWLLTNLTHAPYAQRIEHPIRGFCSSLLFVVAQLDLVIPGNRCLMRR